MLRMDGWKEGRTDGSITIKENKDDNYNISSKLMRNILVNTLESTSFNGFWPNLVHIYLVLKTIWNPIDFQGHMSKVKVTGSNLLLCTILVNTLESTLGESGTLLIFKVTGYNFYLVNTCSKKNWPCDLDLWKSIGFQTVLRTKYVPSLKKNPSMDFG
jgi:hypothetical protein